MNSRICFFFLPNFVSDFTFTGKQITSESTDCSIPTLRRVFEEFPDIPMNIDIKTNNDELIDKVKFNLNFLNGISCSKYSLAVPWFSLFYVS